MLDRETKTKFIREYSDDQENQDALSDYINDQIQGIYDGLADDHDIQMEDEDAFDEAIWTAQKAVATLIIKTWKSSHYSGRLLYQSQD